MKVCIPCTDATGRQARLHIPYGQAPFFALWDRATDQLEFQANPLAGQAQACACATTRWMQRSGAGVLITGDLGRRAAQRLKEAGIEVLQAPAVSLGELLERYHQADLASAPAGEPHWLLGHGAHHAEHHGHAAHGQAGECGCGAAHGGQHAQGPHEHHGHRHAAQGHAEECCCGETHRGQHAQGHHGQEGHSAGCCHSA